MKKPGLSLFIQRSIIKGHEFVVHRELVDSETGFLAFTLYRRLYCSVTRPVVASTVTVCW